MEEAACLGPVLVLGLKSEDSVEAQGRNACNVLLTWF